MHDDELLLVAALVVLVMLTSGPEWGDPLLWYWPVPDAVLGGVTYPAEQSQEWRSPDHLGVDVMFRRSSGFDKRALGFQGHDGDERWFAPPDTPVLAARAGRVWSVDKSARGVEVVIDHGAPWATYYQHLTSASVAPGDFVTAGQRIGVMGYDPTDPEGLRHLHFAAWYRGHGDAASVDPERAMSSWQRAQWVRGASNGVAS